METPLTDWVNVSISTADMPSTGIGNIFRRESTPDAPYKVDDLTGLLTVISGGGSAAAVGTQGSIVIWQKYAVQECYESGWKCNWFSTVSDSMLLVNPSTIPLAVLKSIHAIGIMTGIEATSDIAGVGVNAFTYYMTV